MARRPDAQIMKVLRGGSVSGPEGKLSRLFKLSGCNRNEVRDSLKRLQEAGKAQVERDPETSHIRVTRIESE